MGTRRKISVGYLDLKNKYLPGPYEAEARKLSNPHLVKVDLEIVQNLQGG